MFERIKDAYLEHYVKTQLKNYYLLIGLDPKDIESKTLRELFDLVKTLCLELQGRNSILNDIIKKQDLVIQRLNSQNDILSKRNEALFDSRQELIEKVAESKLSEQEQEEELERIKSENIKLRNQVDYFFNKDKEAETGNNKGEVLINEQGEVDREYDLYFAKLDKCNDENEVVALWKEHNENLSSIHGKYAKHRQEVNERGIEFA